MLFYNLDETPCRLSLGATRPKWVVDERLGSKSLLNDRIRYCKACFNVCRITLRYFSFGRWGNVGQVRRLDFGAQASRDRSCNVGVYGVAAPGVRPRGRGLRAGR